MDNDFFRLIEGFPGYRVNKEGEVQSRWLKAGRHSRLTETWRRLRPFSRDGYPSVNLSRGGKKSAFKIHRLVLAAFAGLCPEGMVACHNDGDRGNCELSNLRWDTQRSNADDSLRHGTRAVGSRCNSKLVDGDVVEIRRLRAEGVPAKELAGRYGVSRANIDAIVSRRSWRHLPSMGNPFGDAEERLHLLRAGEREAA